MFLQAYNTAGYYVGLDGKCSGTKKSSDWVDQKDVRFLSNILVRMKQVLTTDTIIILGQVATQSSGGAGTIFNNGYADVYLPLCLEHNKIMAENINGPYEVHLGTWSCQKDSEGGNKYIRSATSRVCGVF